MRYQIIVEGRVQGVGFRSFVEQEATNWDVTGKVKNLEDGNVLIEVQGDEKEIETFLNKVEKGNGFAEVTSFTSHKLDPVDGETRFRTVY